MLEFTVIDTTTNEYPDLWKIASTEEWAKHLMYCDMEGFAISEDGQLILLDECGSVAYCPADRFKVVYAADVVPKSDYIQQIAEAQGLREALLEAKAEIATEIIQNTRIDNRRAIQLIEGGELDPAIKQAKIECYNDILGYLENFTKKYTEDELNEH